jgi:protein-disulfide isomerase
MKRHQTAKAILLVLAALGVQSVTAQESSPRPLSKSEIEQIVKDYLMQHPDVIMDSVRQYQERQRADLALKAKQSLTSRRADLLQDPSSPASRPLAAKQVNIIEFFDYRCGYCKKVEPTLEKVLAANPEVRIVYKEFPILGPESTVAAKAALASVNQGKYEKFHSALMLSQTITTASIDDIAAKVGLDLAKLKTDMASPQIEAQINKNMDLAKALDVGATPTFVVGSDVVPGAMDADALQKMIDKAKAGL